MALALLAHAVGLSACGGGSSDTAGLGEEAITTPAPSTSTTPARAGGRGGAARATRASCVAQGITVPPFNEGTCVERRTRYVVANGRSVLRMRSLKVALRAFGVADEIRGASPQGVFLTVTLRVQNTTDEPQRFRAGQTLLVVDERQYEERSDVEETNHPSMLAYDGRDPIAPGRLVEGVVVYDIPIEEIERVTSRGVLFIVNFEGNPRGVQPEFGQFRIYAA